MILGWLMWILNSVSGTWWIPTPLCTNGLSFQKNPQKRKKYEIWVMTNIAHRKNSKMWTLADVDVSSILNSVSGTWWIPSGFGIDADQAKAEASIDGDLWIVLTGIFEWCWRGSLSGCLPPLNKDRGVSSEGWFNQCSDSLNQQISLLHF